MKQKLITLSIAICNIFVVVAQSLVDPIYTLDKRIPSYINVERQRLDNNSQKGNFLKETLKLNRHTSVELVDTLTDVKGGYHESYKEYYKGIEVEGTRYTIHYDKNGFVTSLNGNFRTIDELSIVPRISEETALINAIDSVGAEKYIWEDENADKQYPQGKLVVYHIDATPLLAFRFHIQCLVPFKNLHVFVDAISGKVLNIKSLSYDATTSVNTVFSGVRSISTQLYSSSYRLRDYTRGNGIETFNYNNGSYCDYTSTDNSWSNLVGNDRYALDAHWGLEMTYDFYYNHFGRNSYDNYGGIINAIVNVDDDDAFWMGLGYMYLGESYVCLDIMAHEFTHGVTQSTSYLDYQGESGAINEGLSDVFATCVENESKPNNGNNIWLCGEDRGTPVRDMMNPTCKYYQGTGWVNTSNLNNDHGGVHTNSGVFNYWFYLLAHGGSGTNEANNNYSVSGIGLENAIQICYLMNTSHLTSNSTFADARTCSENAAQQLGYDYYQKLMVSEAWYAVGVGFAPVKVSISGEYKLCSQEIYTISNIPSGASVALNTDYSNSGFSIKTSSNLNITYYSNGSLTVEQVTGGPGYIKVFYKGHLLATKDVLVDKPIINDVYYMSGNIYVEAVSNDSILHPRSYRVIINGITYRPLGGMGVLPLPNGTYNVEAYVSNTCAESDPYYGQIYVYGNYYYSLGNISGNHQVTIETIDFSGSPLPLESFASKLQMSKTSDDVPYTLKNVLTGEIVSQGTMPQKGGVLDFSSIKSGLFVLTLMPSGSEPETFKLSLK